MALRNESFVRRYVLPRISEAVGTEFVVGEFDIEPFSGISLRRVAIGSGERAFLKLKSVELRYSPLELLREPHSIEKLHIDALELQLRQAADGTWNFPTPPADKATPSRVSSSDGDTEAEVPLLKFKDLKVQNTRVLYQQLKVDGSVDTEVDLHGLGLSSPLVQNTASSKLRFDTSSGVQIEDVLKLEQGNLV